MPSRPARGSPPMPDQGPDDSTGSPYASVQSSSRIRLKAPGEPPPDTEPTKKLRETTPTKTPSPGTSNSTLLPWTSTPSSGDVMPPILTVPPQRPSASVSSTARADRCPLRSTTPSQVPSGVAPFANAGPARTAAVSAITTIPERIASSFRYRLQNSAQRVQTSRQPRLAVSATRLPARGARWGVGVSGRDAPSRRPDDQETLKSEAARRKCSGDQAALSTRTRLS